MTTRAAFPGTVNTSTPISATNNNRLPGGWIGYAEKVANQSGITTEVDVTGLQEDVTLVSGRRYRVEALVHVQSASGAVTALLEINDGANRTQIGRVQLAATAHFHTMTMSYYVTGDGNSHDLQVRAAGSAGGIDVVAGGEFPCYLAVVDVGPAS